MGSVKNGKRRPTGLKSMENTELIRQHLPLISGDAETPGLQPHRCLRFCVGQFSMPTIPLTHGCEPVGANCKRKYSFSNVFTFRRTSTLYSFPGVVSSGIEMSVKGERRSSNQLVKRTKPPPFSLRYTPIVWESLNDHLPQKSSQSRMRLEYVSKNSTPTTVPSELGALLCSARMSQVSRSKLPHWSHACCKPLCALQDCSQELWHVCTNGFQTSQSRPVLWDTRKQSV